MSQKISILLADDHKMFREGLKAILSEVENFSIDGEAENGFQVEALMRERHFDIILMDIRMPEKNGIETTESLSHQYPDTRILALSMHNEDRYILNMLKAGARGYVLKNTGKNELIEAIQTLYNGSHYFSPEVSSRLLGQFIHDRNTESASELAQLTKRELEVLKLIAEEFTNAEIAEKLFISKRTVDTHRKNLLQKTGAKNTVGLVKFALQNGII